MDRRTIGAWCLYDFGNSAFAILFPAWYGSYYAKHVVGGDGGDAVWGLLTSVSMLLVALSAPLMGGIADHAGVRKRMLLAYTAAGVGAVLGFAFVGPGAVVAGFLLGVLANFAFEGGIVFYNAYLPEIAPPDHAGRVSARGFALGYLGSLVALAAAAPLTDAGLLGWVWVALALQWSLAAVPAFRYLPPDPRGGMGLLEAARRGFGGTAATFREVLARPNLRRFLLAYFFYTDGVNTVIAFASVYAGSELGFEGAELLGLFALVQVSALLGSAAMGPPADRRGPLWAVRVLLVWWLLVAGAAFFATTKPLFLAAAVLAGLGLGGIQASSRALMARLVPEGREAEFFGFYALCGKTGAILGPVLFGIVASLSAGAWHTRRPAILVVTLFYLTGLWLLRRVRTP